MPFPLVPDEEELNLVVAVGSSRSRIRKNGELGAEMGDAGVDADPCRRSGGKRTSGVLDPEREFFSRLLLLFFFFPFSLCLVQELLSFSASACIALARVRGESIDWDLSRLMWQSSVSPLEPKAILGSSSSLVSKVERERRRLGFLSFSFPRFLGKIVGEAVPEAEPSVSSSDVAISAC